MSMALATRKATAEAIQTFLAERIEEAFQSPRPTIPELEAAVVALLWTKHPGAEEITAKFDPQAQTFRTVVRYPPVVALSITITLD